MSKKTYIVIGVLSVVIWYISRIVQAIWEALIVSKFSVSVYSGECSATGYPIPLCINRGDNILPIYHFINISFWFMFIFGIWKLIRKTSKK